MTRISTELVINYPMMSEDTVKLIETENKIVFIVHGNASKRDIWKAVEELYEVKVDQVHTLVTPEGKKKAYVRLGPESKASELAVKVGILERYPEWVRIFSFRGVVVAISYSMRQRTGESTRSDTTA